MGLQPLDINKIWYRGTLCDEPDWDNIKDPLEAWAASLLRDINQLALDMFGPTYSFDNDGLPNNPSTLYDFTTHTSALPWIFSNTVTFTNTVVFAGTVAYNGLFALSDSADDHYYIFNRPFDLAADRNVTLPLLGAADTFVFENFIQTLTNKDLTLPRIDGAGAGHAILQYVNSATNRTITIPDPGADDTVCVLNFGQTLANKTLTTPTIGSFVNAGHTHADAAGGGTLTWANALAVANAGNHTHADNTTGNTLTWANALAVANAGNHTHADNTTGNTLTWANALSVAGAGDHAHTGNTTGGVLGAQVPADHAHTAVAGQGGQLDWDNVWSDAVHTHSSAAEGGSDLGICTSAQIDDIYINDNDIYKRTTDADGEVLFINRIGYNGGNTRTRTTVISDGKNTANPDRFVVVCDGAHTNSVYPNVAYFFTSPALDLTTPVTGWDRYNAVALTSDNFVGNRSVCKAWGSYTCSAGAGNKAVLDGYNVGANVVFDGANLITVTFDKAFANANYAVVTGAAPGIGNAISAKNVGSVVFSISSATDNYSFAIFGHLTA